MSSIFGSTEVDDDRIGGARICVSTDMTSLGGQRQQLGDVAVGIAFVVNDSLENAPPVAVGPRR
jgi:hypothetical protein